jgi:hypothetical protein
MPCQDFRNCLRCSVQACDHINPLRSITGVCIGYIGYPDCSTCGETSWKHNEEAPHAITDTEPTCPGYSTPGGIEQFQGGGGGFGGGGASGGW